MAADPERLIALLLDGELQGVPYAGAYGCSLQAIRAFPNFWRLRGYRQACYKVRLVPRFGARCGRHWLASNANSRWTRVFASDAPP